MKPRCVNFISTVDSTGDVFRFHFLRGPELSVCRLGPSGTLDGSAVNTLSNPRAKPIQKAAQSARTEANPIQWATNQVVPPLMEWASKDSPITTHTDTAWPTFKTWDHPGNTVGQCITNAGTHYFWDGEPKKIMIGSASNACLPPH